MRKDYSEIVKRIDFSGGAIPVIVQDSSTRIVLIHGYMNVEALWETIDTGFVTFYKRSQNTLYVKGSTSKNYLHFVDLKAGCDFKSLLIKAKPDGVVCHTGADTCYNETNTSEDFIRTLEKIVEARKKRPISGSYTSTLFKSGANFMAQKFGESSLKVLIESKDNNDKQFTADAADLLYHYLVLLKSKNKSIDDVVTILEKRYVKKE